MLKTVMGTLIFFYELKMNGCQTKRVELLRLRVLSSTFNGGDDPYFLYTDPELASWCVWNQPLPKAPLNVVICVDFHVNKLRVLNSAYSVGQITTSSQ
jgi:hypothetical protein